MYDDIRLEPRTPWTKDTVIRTPCAPELMCHKSFTKTRLQEYTEAFNPDDPTLVDRLATYQTDAYLGD